MTRESEPRRVLLLTDGRPGHYRQAEGVVAALGRLGPLDVSRVLAASSLPRLARLLRRAAASPLAQLVLSLDLPQLAVPERRPDLIVSAGGLTLIANIALARLTGAQNIFCGSLRNAPESAVTLWITGYADIAAPRHVSCLKPTPVDPDLMRAPRAWPGRTLALIAGGPTAAQGFSASDWEGLASLLDAGSWGRELQIEVVTSPRTPPEAADTLSAAARRAGAAFVDFRTAGPGSIMGALDRADAVAVTADSMSMVFEGVAARRPVVALVPSLGAAPRGETRMLADLAARGLIATLSVDSAPAAIDANLAALRPLLGNHLDDLARTLGRRLGWLPGSELPAPPGS